MRSGDGKEQSGYGVVCYREGKIIHQPSAVLDAEMYALAHAVMTSVKAVDVIHDDQHISHLLPF